MKSLLIFSIGLLIQSASAATYHVATTGSDAAAGTIGAPWLTIQKAANTLTAGNNVIVAAGNYPEHVTTAAAGTAGNRITFTASGTVTMRGFTVNHAYTTISGFTIDQHSDVSTPNNAAVVLGDNGDYAVVSGNTIKNTMYLVASDVVVGNTNPDTITSAGGGFTAAGFRAGVKVWVYRTAGVAAPANNAVGFLVDSVTDTVLTLDGAAAVTAEGPVTVLLTGAQNYGLFTGSGCTGATISGNTFSDFGYRPILMQGSNHTFDGNIVEKVNGWDAIGFNGTGHVISDNWIRDSLTVKANYPSADVFAHWSPIDASNITISGNYVSDWAGAINVDHLTTQGTNSNITYSRNVFYGNLGPIIVRMPNVTLENNTFVNVSNAVTSYVQAVDHPYYFDISKGGVSGGVIQNNIFVGCGNQATSGASHGWYELQTGVTANYNLASGPSPGFVTKTGFSETNGINGGDPGFINISLPLGADGLPFTADDGLRLAPGSQAIGTGVGGADLGAYDYEAAASASVEVQNLNVTNLIIE